MATITLNVPSIVESVEQLEGVLEAGAYPTDERHDGPVGITLTLTDEVAEDPDYLPDEVEALLPDGVTVEVTMWPSPDFENQLALTLTVPVYEVRGAGFIPTDQ